MARPLGKDSIEILVAAVTIDSHNSKVDDWAHATTTTVPGCYVQHGASEEYLVNRDDVLIEWTVWAPAGTLATALNRVRYLGVIYEVHGNPSIHKSFSGRLDHVTIVLKKWNG